MSPSTLPNPGFSQRASIRARLNSHIAANASGFLQVAVSKAPRPADLTKPRFYDRGAYDTALRLVVPNPGQLPARRQCAQKALRHFSKTFQP